MMYCMEYRNQTGAWGHDAYGHGGNAFLRFRRKVRALRRVGYEVTITIR